MFAVASTLSHPSLLVIGRRDVTHSFDRDGRLELARAPGVSHRQRHCTSDRLTSPEVGRVVVDAIACYLKRGYKHDGMPISSMRRTRHGLPLAFFPGPVT